MDTKIFWEIIELFVIMLIVATVAYAPLGYFINSYTRGDGHPFGKHGSHDDEHTHADSH